MWDTWGNAVDVSASSTQTDQHGMASVAKVISISAYLSCFSKANLMKLPNKQYVIAFESSQNGSDVSTVGLKITTTPEKASTERILEVTTASGAKPAGAPFVTWSSIGGANGTIILSDSASNSVFINQALGNGPWKVVSTTAGRAFGREVRTGKRHGT